MRKFKKSKKIFLVLTILLLLTFTAPAGAVVCSKILTQKTCETTVECDWDTISGKCCDQLEIRWPNSPLGTSIARCTNVTGMVKYFYEWGIALGGLAAFVALIIGGFLYLTSMGEPTRLAEAKDRIKSAFFGLILLLSSWLILNTINPQLTTLKAKLELVQVTPEELRLGPTELKPCEFAVLYENTNWDGKSATIKPTPDPVKKWHLGLGNINSYIIYKEREITTLECDPAKPPPENTLCVKNPDTTKNCLKDYCLLEPCNPETEHCLTKDGKYYKAGGACVLEFYYQTTWWIVKTGECGDKMVSIGDPAVGDLTIHLQNPSDIFCARLIQITTKK